MVLELASAAFEFRPQLLDDLGDPVLGQRLRKLCHTFDDIDQIKDYASLGSKRQVEVAQPFAPSCARAAPRAAVDAVLPTSHLAAKSFLAEIVAHGGMWCRPRSHRPKDGLSFPRS